MMLAIRDRWCIGGWVAGMQVLVEAGRAAKRTFPNTSNLHNFERMLFHVKFLPKGIHKSIQNMAIKLM